MLRLARVGHRGDFQLAPPQGKRPAERERRPHPQRYHHPAAGQNQKGADKRGLSCEKSASGPQPGTLPLVAKVLETSLSHVQDGKHLVRHGYLVLAHLLSSA